MKTGLKADEADSGAVTLIQRFGSAANLNVHLHCLVLNGVYRFSADGAPEFVEAPAPIDEALQAVLHKIITRTMKLLTRRGVLVEEDGSTYMADNDGDSDEARTLRPLQTGLHAAVRCGADDREALEQLCRYITRPALANERVQTNAAGQVVLRLITPWRDGTTPLVMSPLEFMQRLAALVPRPRLHLIRLLGVLAPNAKLRTQIVPQDPELPAQAVQPAACGANCARHRPLRLSWAKLLKRVFKIDMEHCPNCGGELKIIAAILEQPVIEKIFTHLGLQARAPLARRLAARRCKRLDDSDPPLFERPDTQGRRSRLRAGGYGTDRDGLATRSNP